MSQQAGRDKEFTELVREYRHSLYALARHLLRDKNEAEDVLQEALLAAYQSYDRFERGTNFKNWIFKFLVNKILNANKKTRKYLPLTMEVSDDEVLKSLNMELAYDAVLENPQKLFEQIGDQLKSALENLNPAERMIFLLRSLEDFSYKEMAHLLNIPAGTVMSHLSRGRVKLRQQLVNYARERHLIRI